MTHRWSRRSALGALAVPFLGRTVKAAESYTLRMTFGASSFSFETKTALHLAAAVQRRTNGQVKIEVYPGAQIVKEQETTDALASGVVDLAIQSTAFLSMLFPQLQIFSAPFLFKDYAAGFRVLDGPIGNEFFGAMEAKGLLGLGWGIGGFRELETTSKAVVVPEDLKGLRMRIQNGAVYAAMFQALGAIPVPIDVSEAYVALSQHTVDGIELPIAAFTSAKYYTIVRHVALSHHVLAIEPLTGSKRKIEAMPARLQAIVKEEAHAAVPLMRNFAMQEDAAAVQTLKQNGVAVTEIQYAAFRKAEEPVYAMLDSKLSGGLVARVRRAAGS